MENIPYEIILKILERLDIKDCIALFKTCKYNGKISNDNFFWKKRCLKEYIFPIHTNTTDIPKSIYIKYYKTLCVCCLNPTRYIEKFYKKRVCNNCQKTVPKYISYSKTQAITEYHLKKYEINNINGINIGNKNYYLDSSIKEYIHKKKLINVLIERKRKKTLKIINKITLVKLKYITFRELMFYYHNINIEIYSSVIDKFSCGIYKRYIMDTSCKYEDTLFKQIVDIYIIIDHLNRIGHLNYTNYTYKDINELLLKYLLLDYDRIGNSLHFYIEKIKYDILNKQKSLFLKKRYILEKFIENGIIFNIPLDSFLNIIMNIKDTTKVNDLIDSYIIDGFLRQNFDINVVYNKSIQSGKKVKEIYKQEITKKINDNLLIFIPMCVIKKYNLEYTNNLS